jgi:plastocyanin
MRAKTVAVAIVVVIVLVGGGIYLATRNTSNPTQPTASQDHQMNMAATDKTASAPVATNSVTIANFAFSPANITVKKGTTVTWVNNDATAHTVTENDGQTGPNSGTMAKGARYTFTYDTIGTFQYHCTFHSEMVGTVTVTE